MLLAKIKIKLKLDSYITYRVHWINVVIMVTLLEIPKEPRLVQMFLLVNQNPNTIQTQ